MNGYIYLGQCVMFSLNDLNYSPKAVNVWVNLFHWKHNDKDEISK